MDLDMSALLHTLVKFGFGSQFAFPNLALETFSGNLNILLSIHSNPNPLTSIDIYMQICLWASESTDTDESTYSPTFDSFTCSNVSLHQPPNTNQKP